MKEYQLSFTMFSLFLLFLVSCSMSGNRIVKNSPLMKTITLKEYAILIKEYEELFFVDEDIDTSFTKLVSDKNWLNYFRLFNTTYSLSAIDSIDCKSFISLFRKNFYEVVPYVDGELLVGMVWYSKTLDIYLLPGGPDTTILKRSFFKIIKD